MSIDIYIYKVSCHSHARQQQTIHLYVQHRNRVTRKVTRAEAIDHLLSATLTLLGDYQQGQRNEGVSMIARDNSTYNSSYHVRRKKKRKKKINKNRRMLGRQSFSILGARFCVAHRFVDKVSKWGVVLVRSGVLFGKVLLLTVVKKTLHKRDTVSGSFQRFTRRQSIGHASIACDNI